MASADAMASLKRSPSQAVLELDKSAVPVQLKIGLAVSAKYRGAWCEGQIIRRTEGLTCKVQFNSDNSVAQVKSTDIRGDIQLNKTVEAFHDESETFRKAVVLKVTDGSQYTVRFPDGDERIVRRNGVTLMGPTHFNEGSSLSEFPLTDPVSFGTPVTASGGARKRRRVTENGSAESSPESAPRPSEGESSETAGAAGAAGSDSSPNGMDASGSCPDGREEAPPPTGTHHEVVLINPSRDGLDTGQLWWPALVVPAAEVMREMIGANDVDHKYQFVVRFFEDNLYAIIEQQYIKTLKRGTNPFEHFCDSPKFLRQPAVARALEFLDEGKLPNGFRWKTYSDKCDVEAAAAAAWEEEHHADAKQQARWAPNPVLEANFLRSHSEFMTKIGTPIKRTPSLGFKDLDLFRLYTLVAGRGGHTAVSAASDWREVYSELLSLDDDEVPQSADRSLRSAYEKYLKAYEESLAEIKKNGTSGMSAGDIAVAAGHAVVDGGSAARGEEVTPASPYRFEVGKQARCEHTDSKYYPVTIEDRTVEDGEGGHHKRYYVHYLQWARRFDTWVDEDKLKEPEPSSASSSGNSNKRRARRRDPAVEPSVSPMMLDGGPSPSDLLQIANSVTSLDGVGGRMTDEELARTLALAEAAQSGRRRETRRSWNASLAEVQKQGEITTQIQELRQLKSTEEEGDAATEDVSVAAAAASPEATEPNSPEPKPAEPKPAEPKARSKSASNKTPRKKRKRETAAQRAAAKAASATPSANVDEPPHAPTLCFSPACEGVAPAPFSCYSVACPKPSRTEEVPGSANAAGPAIETPAITVDEAADSMETDAPPEAAQTSEPTEPTEVPDDAMDTDAPAAPPSDETPAEPVETVYVSAFIAKLSEMVDKTLDEKIDMLKEEHAKHNHAVRVKQARDRRAALGRARANAAV